ncbi:MAG: methyltransferase family protein [Candidatus Thorarchaeota archaeon]
MAYNDWLLIAVWFVLFGVFIAFLPFRRRTQRRPAGVYLAFVVAIAFEMFGIPLSIYFISWAFGIYYPLDPVWGHTLYQYIGLSGMWIGFGLNFVGVVLVILGWKNIHKEYWSKDSGEGRLVTAGIYRFMRHPQYTGFLIITLGLLVHWVTIPLLIMWPILIVLYYRLARYEEGILEEEFGEEYIEYRKNVPMFLPNPKRHL